MGIFEGIFGGLAGIGQSMIEAKTARRNTDMTIDANRKMAEYQYSKDLEMWNRANEYNSPSSQMKRYSSAGLNPNLIYGTGSASAGNTATTLPKYQAPTQQYNYRPPVDLQSTISMFQDYQLKQAQIDNLREQKRNIQLDGDLKYYNKTLWEPDVATSPIGEQSIMNQLKRYQMEVVKAEADTKLKMIGKRMNELDLKNELKQKEINWFVANSISNIASKSLGALGLSRLGGLKPIGYYNSLRIKK